jgi:3-oxoacyl-[acyl-carrier-protein] synthase-3
VVEDGTAASDLGTEAALQACERAGVNPAEIDLIIAGSITPDMMFPSTACTIQKNLKASQAAAFDLSAACSGFIYGLCVADRFIRLGGYQKILVVGSEVLSKVVDWEDRSTCVLFGDAAGAAIVMPSHNGRGIESSFMRSDGSLGDLLYLPGGGSRNPTTHETIDNKLHYIKMEGNRVFKIAVQSMAGAVKTVLGECGYKVEDIDLLIPHQANRRIIDAIGRQLHLPAEKVFVNVQEYGNTSAASIPVALDEAIQTGKLKEGDLLCLVAFGGGFTWGSILIRW